MTLRGLRADGQYEVVVKRGDAPLFVGTYDEVVEFQNGLNAARYGMTSTHAYNAGFAAYLAMVKK